MPKARGWQRSKSQGSQLSPISYPWIPRGDQSDRPADRPAPSLFLTEVLPGIFVIFAGDWRVNVPEVGTTSESSQSWCVPWSFPTWTNWKSPYNISGGSNHSISSWPIFISRWYPLHRHVAASTDSLNIKSTCICYILYRSASCSFSSSELYKWIPRVMGVTLW